MSNSANVSNLGQMLDNSSRLRDIRLQLNVLQTQLSTQKKAQDMSGLKSDGTRAVRTRIELNQLSVFQSNIAIGTTQVKSTVNTLQEFMKQAENIVDTISGNLQESQIDLPNLQESARDTLAHLRELLNTQNNGKYILGGADSYTKPMNDTGAHSAYASKLVEDWRTGIITTDTLISSYKATPETTMGYTAAMASDLVKNVYVRADVNQDVDVTLTADEDGFKKVLNGLALIADMNLDKVSIEDDDPVTTTTAPGADADAQKDNFFQLYEDVIKHINQGIEGLRGEEERLQRAQLALQTAEKSHVTDKNALEDILGGIEDVDPAEVAVRITALQTQLESAYQATALIGSLSLTRYL